MLAEIVSAVGRPIGKGVGRKISRGREVTEKTKPKNSTIKPFFTTLSVPCMKIQRGSYIPLPSAADAHGYRNNKEDGQQGAGRHRGQQGVRSSIAAAIFTFFFPKNKAFWSLPAICFHAFT